ncbi:hypothetical protein TFLX_00219 [Thermoflexales bacterium]|nr:hypothetical protein TFLX_00219 [Thermoflexales bacterium]
MSLQCLRCGTLLAFAGTREFHEGTRWGFIGDWGELLINKEAFDVYFCPHCGKVEFFLSGQGEAKRAAPYAEAVSPASDIQSAGEASRSNLLGLKPGQSQLTDLYQHIGYPSAYRQVGGSTALRYAARFPDTPDVAVVDRVTSTLKLVAIANADAAFSLSDLIAHHGEPEFAGIFNGNEHHFFAGHGLAIVAAGRAESDILYVQVLPVGMTLNDYIAADGYAAETFVFASP